MVRTANVVLKPLGHEIRKNYPDVYLHRYESYEHYKRVQVFHNKRKLGTVWADKQTLILVAERVTREFGKNGERPLFGICHGARNGFEQNCLSDLLSTDIIGTDISDTAAQFPRSVQWDFHDVNPDWLGRCDFVYSNSLDQSWKPKEAASTWLDQLRLGGLLFIEHSRAHGPEGASEMDPFGVKAEYMPYVLSEWFGHRISLEILKGEKANMDMEIWLFVMKRLR